MDFDRTQRRITRIGAAAGVVLFGDTMWNLLVGAPWWLYAGDLAAAGLLVWWWRLRLSFIAKTRELAALQARDRRSRAWDRAARNRHWNLVPA